MCSDWLKTHEVSKIYQQTRIMCWLNKLLTVLPFSVAIIALPVVCKLSYCQSQLLSESGLQDCCPAWHRRRWGFFILFRLAYQACQETTITTMTTITLITIIHIGFTNKPSNKIMVLEILLVLVLLSAHPKRFDGLPFKAEFSSPGSWTDSGSAGDIFKKLFF